MRNLELIEYLKSAIEHEKRAMEHYQKMALEAEDPETRLMLEQLARDEESHYHQLNKRMKALKLMA